MDEDSFKQGEAYLEAQIMEGVDLDEIARIDFPRDLKADRQKPEFKKIWKEIKKKQPGIKLGVY